MKRNPEAVCKTCPYWWISGGEIGECRHSSPATFSDSERCYAEFPPMTGINWCGRHPDIELVEEEEVAQSENELLIEALVGVQFAVEGLAQRILNS